MTKITYDGVIKRLSINGSVLEPTEQGDLLVPYVYLADIPVMELPKDLLILPVFSLEGQPRLVVHTITVESKGSVRMRLNLRVCIPCWRGPKTAREFSVAVWGFMQFLMKTNGGFELMDIHYDEPEYVISFIYRVPLQNETVDELVKKARTVFEPIRAYARQWVILETSTDIRGTRLAKDELLQQIKQASTAVQSAGPGTVKVESTPKKK